MKGSDSIAAKTNSSLGGGRGWVNLGLTALKLLLLVVFLAISNEGVFDRLGHFYRIDYTLALLVFTGIWAISLIALIIAAFLPRFMMRLLWAIPIAASTFMGTLALEVMQLHLTFYDVVLYWAERSNVGNAVSLYAHWFLIAGAKTLVGVVAILLPPGFLLPRASKLVLAPITPIVAIVALLLLEGGRGTKAFPEQFSSIAMVSTLAIVSPFAAESKRMPMTMTPKDPGLARHIFLVVDESVRGDFLDLNEPRGATPYLNSQRDRIANFGYAVAANNCSLFSNLVMRYGARPPDVAAGARSNPSIWLYAKAAGYKTVYLDAQQVVGRLQGGMTLVERGQVDQFEQFSDLPRTERDFVMAKRLLELAADPEPSFVYVNKQGAHFPYIENYPEGIEPFQPTLQGGAMGEDRELLVNSYKNSIHWNVDGFFRELLASDLDDVAVVYTSDHGQNLLDRGVMLHCNPSDPHEFEALVPLLAMSGDDSLQRRFEDGAGFNENLSSHFNVFPTILQLLGFDPAEVRAAFGPSLLEPITGDDVIRAFTYGSIAGPSNMKVKWKALPDDLTTLIRDPIAAEQPDLSHATPPRISPPVEALDVTDSTTR